jgi:TRAP-type C4-dicarboxylate transport system permease small subunit
MAPRQVIERLSDLAGDAASYLFLVIVAIASYEVVMRYGFDAPTIWVHELSVALAAVGFLIGGPVVHQRRQHIAITYFLERASPRARRWAEATGSLLALLFLGLLTYAASVQALRALGIMETSGTALNWPIPTVLKSAFALCSAAMLLQTLAHLLTDIRRLRESEE